MTHMWVLGCMCWRTLMGSARGWVRGALRISVWRNWLMKSSIVMRGGFHSIVARGGACFSAGFETLGALAASLTAGDAIVECARLLKRPLVPRRGKHQYFDEYWVCWRGGASA